MPDINDLIALLRAVDDSPTSECGFDMASSAFDRGTTTHPCGSACCIGGHAALALKDANLLPGAAIEAFGVRVDAANAIAYPKSDRPWTKSPAWRANIAQAIRVLEIYRDEGVVDWPRAMAEAA